MFNGRRQPSCDGTSRMTRECQVRICERLGVKFPGPTRQPRPRLLMPRVLECPLRSKSGQANACLGMSGLCHKRTNASQQKNAESITPSV
jgi:hypothetical protein